MITLALTGSIGMGKSTVATMFAEAGIPVFDADAESAGCRARAERWSTDRDALPGHDRATVRSTAMLCRERVLGDPDELAALEAIVHPAVHHERTRFIVEHGDAPALLFDIPLLFETGGEAAFDKVIVVSAPPEVQRARVLARPGMDEAKLDAILARQMPDSEKRERADFVIETGTA